MIARMDPDAPCPCTAGTPKPARYGACCGRWHAGPQHLQAPDAEALMRSRYSAFVLGRNDYLLATWAAETRPDTLADEPPGLRWLGLEVRHHKRIDDTHASVEFVARNKRDGRAARLHESGRFERRDGRWVYVDGALK